MNGWSRSQGPCGRRRGSADTGLMGLLGTIPPGAWLGVACECCVLSGSGGAGPLGAVAP